MLEAFIKDTRPELPLGEVSNASHYTRMRTQFASFLPKMTVHHTGTTVKWHLMVSLLPLRCGPVLHYPLYVLHVSVSFTISGLGRELSGSTTSTTHGFASQ